MEEELLKPYDIKIISFTDQGTRPNNEDRIFYSKLDHNEFLLLVADGMGGYDQGELAAEIAIEVITESIVGEGCENVIEKIERSFLNAHGAINSTLDNAGTTVGGVIIKEHDIYVFWTGDVKIILNNGGTIFSSKEHSLLNLLKEADIIIKPEEVKRLSHTVVRSLGGNSNSFFPEIVRLDKADHFSGIVCSDGIFQYYTNDDLSAALSRENFNYLTNEFKSPSFPDALDNVTGLIFISDS